MSPPLEFRFVTSADDRRKLPPSRAEVAFLGRSNVGKSSLLNALANRTRLAHTSKTPGRTQLLNCFALGDDTTAVDCPGYGFAKVPSNVRARWQRMLEGYLLEREELAMILVLVDGEIGPTKLDVQMLDWLRSYDLDHVVIASKHDKVKPSKRGQRKQDLAAGCGVEPGEVVWVSAAKNLGIDHLRDLIRGWLATGSHRRPAGHVELDDDGGVPPRKAAEPAEPAEYDDEHEWK
ncbi:MAG TPA: ribosome biogenesis GTP-binding protein YihA/YsxC [Acidimicrobiales bacterium]